MRRERKIQTILMALMCLVLLILTLLPLSGRAAVAEPAAGAAGMIDLTGVCEAVLTLLAALVTSVAVPLIRAHTSAKGRLALEAVYRTAVYGAQQLYKAGAITDRLSCAEQWIRAQGYTVDRTRLEAHVKQLNIDTAFEHMEVVSLEQTHEITVEGEEEASEDG